MFFGYVFSYLLVSNFYALLCKLFTLLQIAGKNPLRITFLVRPINICFKGFKWVGMMGLLFMCFYKVLGVLYILCL